MHRPRAKDVPGRGPGPAWVWHPRVGLRIAFGVLLATTLPVISLLWAAHVTRGEVERRALSGLTATATATVRQEQQAWSDAYNVVMQARTRPSIVNALSGGERAGLPAALESLLATGPFGDVRLYDASAALIGSAGMPGTTPTVAAPAGSSVIVGDPVASGSGVLRPLVAPVIVRGARIGELLVDVDMSQLLGNPSGLSFGQTGVKLLVTPSSLIVAGSATVGTQLKAPANRVVAAAGRSSTKLLYSPFFHRLTVESFEPVPDQHLGILVQQSRDEVMATADHLAGLLLLVALGIAVAGTAFAIVLGVFLGRRSRRAAATEARLAATEGASRQRLEQFLDAMPVGVFVTTRDGHPHYANRQAKRLLGRGIAPAATSEDLAEVYQAYVTGGGPYPPEQMPLVRALGGESSHIDDMEIRRPDRTVPVEVWGTPVLGQAGGVEFAIAAFADVSERLRAAEDLQLVGSVTASMGAGVVAIRTSDHCIVHANASFEAMFGYPPGELIGLPVTALNAPGDATPEETKAAIVQSLKAAGDWHGEVHNIRKDGTTFWSAVHVTSVLHQQYGPIWISVHTDITERRASLGALEASEARLAALLDSAPDAGVAVDASGQIVLVNKQTERLFGYSREELMGQSLEILLPERFREAHMRHRGRFMSHFSARQMGAGQDFFGRRRDGSEFPVDISLSGVRTQEGALAMAYVRDVTDRKRSELELQAARDKALEASRLKSQFLANMSHEIRTPMSGVLGMAQLLLASPLDPVQRRRLVSLRESGEGLLAIINDILDFSKVEAGKLEMEEQDFDFLACVENVMSLMASQAHDKGLTLSLDVGPDVPGWVRGDPLRLRQILLNIVGNAVKFTERGSVKLSVRRMAPGRLRFEIRDTGVGIDAAARERLMQPFSQADASTTRRFGGTGLGLAISRQLVGMMGGALDFASQPGAGTTFWFEIDLTETAARPRAAHPSPEGTPGDPEQHETLPALPPGMRILLADDAELNREVGAGLLESIGCRVDTVTTGAQAVDAAQATAYDAILMDCLMPVMDGYEATRCIRRIEGPGHHTPIIALTAAAMSGDRERCLAAGMDDYVAKPFKLDDLQAALSRWAAVAPVKDAGTRSQAPGEPELVERLNRLSDRLPRQAFGRICQIFLTSTPELLAELSTAAGSGNSALTSSLAHKLKGSTATFGAMHLSQLAEQIEHGSPRLDRLLHEIEDEYGRVSATVASMMGA